MPGEQVASKTADSTPAIDTAIRTLPSEPVGSPICIRTHNRAKIRYSRRKVTRADRAGAGAGPLLVNRDRSWGRNPSSGADGTISGTHRPCAMRTSALVGTFAGEL